MYLNDPLSIIFEASSYKERQMLMELSDYEKENAGNSAITKLYNSLLNKTLSNYDSIDASKGDISKLEGYNTLNEVIISMKKVIQTSKVMIPRELEIIEQAIANVERLTKDFTTSYKLEREFGIIAYRHIVADIFAGLSLVLSSTIEFVKNPTMGEVVIVTKMKETGYLPITQLESFNRIVSTGDFYKVMKIVNKSSMVQKEGIAVASTIAIPFIAIGAFIAVITLLREIAFFFYYGRMQLSQYLEHQAAFIDYNIIAVEASKEIDPSKKKDILKKQKAASAKLMKLSDKIRVDHKMTAIQVKDQMKKEEESYSFSSIKDDIKTNIGNGGFKIL